VKQLLLVAFLLFCASNLYAQQIDSIQFEGLTRTKESYLRKIILCEAGQTLDSLQLEKDVFLLRNLNLFFNVDVRTEKNLNEGVNVVFTIQEAKYLYPVIWMSGFKDQLKLILGFNHINFLGRAQSIGATYQYYDRHSLYVFWKANRHGNSRTGHEIALQKYSTIEPLYFDDTMSYFNFDNYSVLTGGHLWLGRYLNAGLGLKYMYEEYEQRDEAFDVGGKGFSFNKYQVHTSLNYNKVEYIYEKMDGLQGGIYGEYIHTEGFPEASFLKFMGRASWFKTVKKRGNIALRGQFGVATNNESPFSPFVLDGILNVRGIGNRIERGTAELIFNAEYRHTFWEHRVFALQGAVFADYGTLREPGKNLGTFFNGPQHIYTGGGIRFNLKVWYKTCIRVDYSVNPADPTSHGISFGFGQFF
jgi:outer membrane protein assembly factor BamA